MTSRPTMEPGLTPERAILLRLLAVDPATAPDPPTASAVDWNAVLDIVAVALSPLALNSIAQGRAGLDVPRQVAQRLQAAATLVAATQARRQSALRLVCAALADASVPVIVLKGAALAYLVYPHPTLRPMRDLDLWVPPDRLDDAVAILGSHGFAPPADHALRPDVVGSPDHRVLESSAHGVRVELHAWLESLTGLAWATFANAWEASEPASLGGIGARVLCPEHQLVHLCLHLARAHAFDLSLLHVLDVALVTRRWRERWDWPRMVRDWHGQRVATWMLLGLVVSRDLLGAAVPTDLERLVGIPSDWSSIRALAITRTWAASRERPPGAAVEVLRQKSAADRLRWLRRRFFDYYWRPPGAVGVAAVARGAGRRLWFDLRVKVPTYVRAWLRGSLRGPALAQTISRERDRAELERLVLASGDLGYPELPHAGPSAAPGRAIAGPPAPR